MERKFETQGVTLSQTEAEEYCAYKRQKKISEITTAMRRAESLVAGGEDFAKACERAARLKISALRLTPTGLEQFQDVIKLRPVRVDCLIGGDGETLAKVKAYEAKQAIRLGARELTVRLTPSLISSCRYTLLRKELKKLRRAAGRAVLKARIEKLLPQTTLSRLLRVCGETEIDYLSIPYFSGCERLLLEPRGNCQLEVSGVDSLPVFQKMAGAGIGRMVTSRAWDIYQEWAQEVEKITVERVKEESAKRLPLPTSQTENAG